ncbi:MAG: hypothetical protein K9N47_23215 [Prosthecobacter sp.]|uniref:hypothetical protein n=1 Tax=Prosthecobacter sp. TaxID=1965333 RepID=UPI00263A3232|nr:hypothetical protein [Prosthecobacter sp.]MCF7789053.1 hypothetical protein [Prosthecobacter sp.]
MAKQSTASPTRIKIGGVEMVLRPQPQKGTISETLLRKAVMKAVAAEQPAKKD